MSKRKVRRHKPSKRDRNITFAVMDNGARIQVSGHRTAEGAKMIPNAKAKPVFVGRVYTGINRGKVYPYASAKRKAKPEPEMSKSEENAILREIMS